MDLAAHAGVPSFEDEVVAKKARIKPDEKSPAKSSRLITKQIGGRAPLSILCAKKQSDLVFKAPLNYIDFDQPVMTGVSHLFAMGEPAAVGWARSKLETLSRPLPVEAKVPSGDKPALQVAGLENIPVHGATPAYSGEVSQQPIVINTDTAAPDTKIDESRLSSASAFSPIGMMLRQQAVVFDLIMDLLHLQHHFYGIWRPPER